jgi:hypothetical protein
VPDLDTLTAALARAVERHNMALFTPVGQARAMAVATLRLAVQALGENDTVLAASVLDTVGPESPDNATATVAGCVGVALGLLDQWLSGRASHAPAGLGDRVRLPAGHWRGERAAVDILALGVRGRLETGRGVVVVSWWVEPRDWPLRAPCPTCGGSEVTESRLTVNTWRHYTWECRACGTYTHWAVHHHRMLHPQSWVGPRTSAWTAAG